MFVVIENVSLPALLSASVYTSHSVVSLLVLFIGCFNGMSPNKLCFSNNTQQRVCGVFCRPGLHVDRLEASVFTVQNFSTNTWFKTPQKKWTCAFKPSLVAAVQIFAFDWFAGSSGSLSEFTGLVTSVEIKYPPVTFFGGIPFGYGSNEHKHLASLCVCVCVCVCVCAVSYTHPRAHET